LGTLARDGKRGAAAAVHMKMHIERSLAVVQLGITSSGLIAGAFGGASVEERLAPLFESRLGLSPTMADALALAALVIPLSLLTIVFAELVPKVLAIRHRESVCCALSPGMQALARLTAPVVGVLEELVKRLVALFSRASSTGSGVASEANTLHELTATAALARTSNLIGAREERIVLSAARLSSREVHEIELAAADISMLQLDASLETALVRAHLDMHTRFPVARVESDPQTIEGYVTFKDLVSFLKMSDGVPSLRAVMRPIQRIPRTTSISAALDRMVRERTHIALVVDTADRVTGMITLEDIIEELVGDIEDEFDRLPSHLQPTGTGFIVGGGITLEALAKRIGIGMDEAAPTERPRPITLDDWVARELGRAPHAGETLTRAGIVLTVRKLRRKRVSEAFIRCAPKGRAGGTPA
jgi:putative hemolysin